MSAWPLPGVGPTAAQVGGLAEIKAGRIQDILGTLKAERSQCSLEHLRGLSAAEVKAELGRFKVGGLDCHPA